MASDHQSLSSNNQSLSSNNQSLTYFHKTPSDVNKLLSNHLKPHVIRVHAELLSTNKYSHYVYTQYTFVIDIMIDDDNYESHVLKFMSDTHDILFIRNDKFRTFCHNLYTHIQHRTTSTESLLTQLNDPNDRRCYSYVYDNDNFIMKCDDRIIRKFSKELSKEISRILLSSKEDIDKFEKDYSSAKLQSGDYTFTKLYNNS
jgi:hypothetical protein